MLVHSLVEVALLFPAELFPFQYLMVNSNEQSVVVRSCSLEESWLNGMVDCYSKKGLRVLGFKTPCHIGCTIDF